MAIYNIFDYHEKEALGNIAGGAKPSIDPTAFTTNHIDENYLQRHTTRRDEIFSAIAARFFFFLLLIADGLWSMYSALLLIVKTIVHGVTFCQCSRIKKSLSHTWLSFKRSLVCGVALVISLFSPALGIMFSCMYFLMYDKAGVDEVVPASLRDQFKELFPGS